MEPNTTVQCRSLTCDVRELEAFVYREAQLLDERRFDEWMGLFTEDGYYWVPARPGQESPLDEVSIFFDDREFMESRFRRLRHPRIHAQIPPSRTLHILSNIRLEDEQPEGADCLMSSAMIMFEYRPGRDQQIFAGRCSHAIRMDGEKIKLAWKKVDLINCDSVFYPILLPF